MLVLMHLMNHLMMMRLLLKMIIHIMCGLNVQGLNGWNHSSANGRVDGSDLSKSAHLMVGDGDLYMTNNI